MESNAAIQGPFDSEQEEHDEWLLSFAVNILQQGAQIHSSSLVSSRDILLRVVFD